MIRLKNIKRIGDLLICVIVPEDAEKSGELSVDIQSRKIISYKLPAGYEWCMSHVRHAAEVLIKMAALPELPTEKTVIWY